MRSEALTVDLVMNHGNSQPAVTKDGTSHSKLASTPLAQFFSKSQAAINGVFGDFLEEKFSTLAVESGFYEHGRPLTDTELNKMPFDGSTPIKICLFLHGLCCNETIWQYGQQDQPQTYPNNSEVTENCDSNIDTNEAIDKRVRTSYGELLAQDSDYIPFYYRYNSGLSVTENGLLFLEHLTRLHSVLPVDVSEYVLVGYSMGGLIIRAAFIAAHEQQRAILDLTSHIFYLSTPHHGAPLEKLATVLLDNLYRIPNPITRLLIRLANTRSQGIKDLGQGVVSDSDAESWEKGVEHHFIGGSIHPNPSHLMNQIIGDYLVRIPSAMAINEEGRFKHHGYRVNYQLFPGVGHFGITTHDAVYHYIARAIAAPTANKEKIAT